MNRASTPYGSRCRSSLCLSIGAAAALVLGVLPGANAQLPSATLKIWNTLPHLGNDPTESVDDPAGITDQGTGAPTIVTLYENTTHPGGPCGVSYWNPDTNFFKWYGFSSGFQSGVEVNRTAPVKVHLPSGAVFRPGDVWIAKSGTEAFLCQFKGTPTFRYYAGIVDAWGVKVDQNSGNIWVTELGAGNIAHFDPATDVVKRWNVGGNPTFLALDGAGRAYCTVAALDQIVRVNPSTNEVTRWPIPGGGLQFPGFNLPNGISVDFAGDVWFSETASDQIGRLDPATGRIREYCKPGLDDPQLIDNGGSTPDLLQAFLAEGNGNAVSVVTNVEAIACVETVVPPATAMVIPTTTTLTFIDRDQSPLTVTIVPDVFVIDGVDGTPSGVTRCEDGTPIPGIIRFPFPGPGHFPAGIGGVTKPFTVRGGNLGSDTHYELESCAIIAPPDCDLDGVLDPDDNCVCTFNPGQEDRDGDGVGDVCDNCPDSTNAGQEDADGDDIGDACDPCPDDPLCDCDGDGVVDPIDNCLCVFNPGQEDTDGDGVGDACEDDNAPPDCSGASASVGELWPPNHKYRALSIVGVTDPDGDPVTITIDGVTQDEAINGLGDGDTCPDARWTNGDLELRAERSGTGNGRVYAVSYTASDGRGGECSGTVTVCVPHDRRPGHECIDDGQTVDSSGPCGGAPRPLSDNGGGGDGRTPILELAGKNPFAGLAQIAYTLPADAHVTIAVYDVLGRVIEQLVDGVEPAGHHIVQWDASQVANGTYFVRMRTGDDVRAVRVTVSK